MRSITCSGEHKDDNGDFLNEQSIIYYDCYRLHISWGRENQFHWSMGIRGRSHLIIGFTSISRLMSIVIAVAFYIKGMLHCSQFFHSLSDYQQLLGYMILISLI